MLGSGLSAIREGEREGARKRVRDEAERKITI